jgi:XXXCH domain-containing protein
MPIFSKDLIMEEKAEHRWSRQKLADYLEDLARGLRQGQMQVEGNTWTVPGEVEAKLHLKEKKGRLILKLKCRWETLGEYQPEAREPVARWQESLKTVKKRLGPHFKEVQGAVSQGMFPDPQTLAAFVADSQALATMAEPEWEEAMQAFLAHLAALERAVASQDLEAARHEVADLHTAMVACHREFK